MNNTNYKEVEVKDIMTTDIITVSSTTLLKDVEKIFIENNIHHVPVVNEENELIGIISKTDMQLMKDWGSRLGLKSALLKNESLLSSQYASDLMTKQLVTIQQDSKLSYCAEVFGANQFHSLPVINGSQLVGILTTFDMINFAFKS